MESTENPLPPTVKKRKVIYLSGYDPRGASHYHSLYQREAEKQQTRTGTPHAVSKRHRNGRFSTTWTVDTETTHTDYEFLCWDDIIRQHWPKKTVEILTKSVQMYAHYFSSGTSKKIRNASKTHFFTFIYPALFLSLLLLVSGLSMVLSSVLIQTYLPGLWLEWLIPPIVGYGIFIKLGEALESRFNFYWLLRILFFFIQLSNERIDGFNERMDAFARHLLQLLQNDDYDEVLIIAHSVGSILLPLIIARALALSPDLNGAKDRISLLTLGHCIPDVSLLPNANYLRKAIRKTLESRLFWLDVTAPPDGACYPLVDVATGCDSPPQKNNEKHPLSISARFHKMFSAEHYQRLKRDRMRIHFQYLMAADYDTDYDFFKITAGPLMLRQRYTPS